MQVSALEASLSRLLDIPGVTGAALVDGVTGLTYCAVGDAREVGDGADAAELASVVTDGIGQCGQAGELECVVMTSARRHHVVQSVRQGGDPLLLVAAMDRTLTNLALGVRQLTEHAVRVLA
ncbi:hypothetical protein [Streptomyces sp. NBC_00829]|uniref:hypothetical protein n=1 Tax=Streptomyces sp. NBC_00829 TaxID=2903679 RepID=UPI0038666A92|nr:hypothetical protein OG293_01320 [Streptomyces sp. NBC_00829]